MAFRNLRAIQGPLALPIGDKTYEIPPLPAEWGVRLRLVAEGGEDDELASMTTQDTLELFLGDALPAMLAAEDVYPEDIERAFLTALADFRRGRTFAERVWELGYDPELVAALTAAAMTTAASSPDSPPSPSSAKARKTPSRAGTSSTTSRRATPRRGRATTAKGSAGQK